MLPVPKAVGPRGRPCRPLSNKAAGPSHTRSGDSAMPERRFPPPVLSIDLHQRPGRKTSADDHLVDRVERHPIPRHPPPPSQKSLS